MLSSHIQKIVDALVRLLPGVGPKTAERYAFALLQQPRAAVEALAGLLQAYHANVTRCGVCFSFAETNPCRICRDSSRERGLICVVARDVDISAIERSGAFAGLYHVLGGVLDPLHNIGPQVLRFKELSERVIVAPGVVQEIVLALPQDIAGEATADYIGRIMPGGVALSRLARGLPSGAEIEYADALTLADAFSGRRAIQRKN